MPVICGGCNLSVEPIKIFEQSKKSKQWWRITKCPRDRCGFNLDLHECDKPGTSLITKPENGGRSYWKPEC